jgi:hypothetical protein
MAKVAKMAKITYFLQMDGLGGREGENGRAIKMGIAAEQEDSGLRAGREACYSSCGSS